MMKRTVINVQSIDNACFAWSVVAALHPAEKKSARKTLYLNYTSVLNLKDIVFLMTLNQIKKFENFNDISINVPSNILHREAERTLDSFDTTYRYKEGETCQFTVCAKRQRRTLCVDKEYFPPRQLTTEQKKEQKILLRRYVYIFTKIINYFDVFTFIVQ